MMIEPERLYEAHCEAVIVFDSPSYRQFPPDRAWEELSWPERDYWQELADELNEADYES